MKKRKILLSTMTVAFMMAISYHGSKSFLNENDSENLLMLQNIEALTDPTELDTPCNNKNGYRQWASSGFLRAKKEFYDCCSKLQRGYNPNDDCRE